MNISLKDLLLGGGGLLLLLLTVIQISPIKVNPWSAIAKAIGRAINADVLRELDAVKGDIRRTQEALETRIEVEDERNADQHRQRILAFNNELLRNIPHTQEDFIEILTEIDLYEDYCESHPKYRNNRAVHAVKTIKRVYDDRLQKHDFL